jgi:hypothetical protein
MFTFRREKSIWCYKDRNHGDATWWWMIPYKSCNPASQTDSGHHKKSKKKRQKERERNRINLNTWSFLRFLYPVRCSQSRFNSYRQSNLLLMFIFDFLCSLLQQILLLAKKLGTIGAGISRLWDNGKRAEHTHITSRTSSLMLVQLINVKWRENGWRKIR